MTFYNHPLLSLLIDYNQISCIPSWAHSFLISSGHILAWISPMCQLAEQRFFVYTDTHRGKFDGTVQYFVPN